MEPLHDPELGARIRRGEERALEELVRAHGPTVLARLHERYSTALSREDLEDVLSIALNVLWRARGRYDPDRGGAGAWLLAIARHVGVDLLRSRRREAEAIREMLDEGQGRPTPDAGRFDPAEPADLRWVRDLLEELPCPYRRILEADISSYPAPAASRPLADELGISARSIPVYRQRARHAFREAMTRRGYSLGEPRG